MLKTKIIDTKNTAWKNETEFQISETVNNGICKIWNGKKRNWQILKRNLQIFETEKKRLYIMQV